MTGSILVSTIHNFPDPHKPALHRLVDAQTGEWQPISCELFKSEVLAVAGQLIALGLDSQETVGIFSENRPEVIEMNYAAWQVGCVPVGIYSTASESQVKYIAGDARIRVMLVGSQRHYEVARAVGIEHIIVVDPEVMLESDDRSTIRFAELLHRGMTPDRSLSDDVAARAAAVRLSDLATLLYTSGTTGQPKGAMLTHGNFTSVLEIHRRRLPNVTEADTSLCFLPLSHIFELAWSTFCLYRGVGIYVNQGPKRVQQSLRETQPTCMCSVPRFWEKVYTVVQEKLGVMGGISKAMMTRALAIGRRRNLEYIRKGLKAPMLLEREYQLYNGRIFKKVRKVIGVDRGNIFPTAGAPIAPEIVEFCHSIGINIVVGYGLSETTATVTCYPLQNFEIGSVGTVLPELRVRIGDNDEIQVKGPTVMQGYFNLPDATAEAFTPDGWFRTGDAGRIDHEGNLFLTDRIKDLFKTSNGKYIAPQALESRLSKDALFEQVAIIGDRRKFVSALIVPDFDALYKYAEKLHIGSHLTRRELAENPRVIDYVSRRIEELTADLAPYEHIKRFVLLTEPFSMENGELTNTLKIRRRVVADRYAKVIDKLYE